MRRPCGAQRHASLQAWLRREEAASEVVGTSLLVVLSIVLASGFSAFVLNMPGPIDSADASLSITLDKGAGGWSTGDEQVVVRHRGGAPLAADETRIVIELQGVSSAYQGAALGGNFTDGAFTIGEVWRKAHNISEDARVVVSVVNDRGSGSRLLARSVFAASDCSDDKTRPSVAFVQTPADLRNGTSGPVTVVATLSDDCAGVDASAVPHLFSRVQDGTGPAFTDHGAMSALGADRWQGTIPHGAWQPQLNQTLEYYVSPVTDRSGNTGASPVQTDLVDYDACGWDTAAPSGVFAQTPSDITMNSTGALTLRLTLSDGCAGVDAAAAPTLHHRVGTASAYASTTMTYDGANAWVATLADPGWLAERGKTLQYYASGLRDLNGNVGQTAVASDLIDNPCASDTAAPVASWTQTPANISGATNGSVALVVALSDACAGVDASVVPRLYHRLEDGTNRSYTDAGAMTSLGGHSWQMIVPDQAWASQAGKAFQYYASPLTDRFGNTAPSGVQSDAIESTDPCAGDTTPPTGAFTQVPANVTMNSTGALNITLTASDACAGVNDGVTPRLYARIGTGPAYTDLGPMNRTGVHVWNKDIPDLGWLANRGATLYYLAGPLADIKGNSANTSVASDLIDNPCAADTAPPTAAFTQSPANVTTHTTGTTTVTALLSDACAGVDGAVTPRIYYRLNDGGNPAYTDGGAMTLVGTNTWQAVLPDLSFANHGGKTLQYHVSPLGDRFANSGSSQVVSDLVDIITTYTYVSSATPTAGTVVNLTDAQAPNGLVASVQEAATTGAAQSLLLGTNQVHVTTFSLGATVPQLATQDGVYAMDASNAQSAYTHAGFADPVTPSGIITGVRVEAVVRISATSASGGIDAWTLEACMTTCGVASPQLGAVHNTVVVISHNVTALHPQGNATWTWSDIENFNARINAVKNNGRDGTWQLDRFYVNVTYAPATYATNVRMDWPSLPSGVSHELELRYRTSGDTFSVQVWNGTAWNARGVTLSSGALTTWSYTLTANEAAGSPRIRFVDTTPGGTTQGRLDLDYARVKTV